MLLPTQRGDLSQFGTMIKHTWGWEIERSLNYESIFFLTSEGNVANKHSPVSIRFVAKTSDIRNFSQNIRSDVKTSQHQKRQHWSKAIIRHIIKIQQWKRTAKMLFECIRAVLRHFWRWLRTKLKRWTK